MAFTVIHDKFVDKSVEEPTTAADVFELALRGLNPLEEQQELLASVPGCRVPFSHRKHRYTLFGDKHSHTLRT